MLDARTRPYVRGRARAPCLAPPRTATPRRWPSSTRCSRRCRATPARSPHAARCGCGWASPRRRCATSTRPWRSTRATRPRCCGAAPRSCAAPSPRRRSRTSTPSPAATPTRAGPPVAQFRAEALLALGRAEEALGDLESAPASALDAQMLAIRGEARLELGRPGEALADAQHALEQHATHDAARAVLVQSFLAVAATIPPPARARGSRRTGRWSRRPSSRAAGTPTSRRRCSTRCRTPSSCCGCAAAGVRARCSAASPFSSPPSR